MRRAPQVLLALVLGFPSANVGAEPARRSELRRAGDDGLKRYFLTGPRNGEPVPTAGHPLLLVLPGGDGGKGFEPFVKNLADSAVPDHFLVAQLIAIKWTDQQKTVWPTEIRPVEKQRFSTEQFAAAVIQDVGGRHRIDPGKVFVLAWSSGGPAAYALALKPQTPVTGSYIAMSVFYGGWCPPLANARGHAFLIDHSPEDKVCKFSLARNARDLLARHGARTKLVTYAGGHGWRDNPFARVRGGLAWLERSSE